MKIHTLTPKTLTFLYCIPWQTNQQRSQGHLQIKKKPDNQWGVFSSRMYAKGTVVISSQPVRDEFSPTPGVPNPKSTSCSHAIQISWDKHMMMDLPARFLNHSCDPNVGVGDKLNQWGSYDFVALRDIAAGEVSVVDCFS